MEPDDILPRLIGERIAAARTRLNLSLDEVSARTRVSRAMISRIERGEVHASAVVLDRLCAGLNLTLSALFAEEARSPLLRHADQPVWRDPDTGYLRREIAPSGTGSPVRIVEIDFPAGAVVEFPPSRFRAIEQHVWVIEGTVAISWADTTYRLERGDCLHMHPDTGLTFRNPTDAPARYAVILTLEPLP